ncbi:MAG: PhoH family protein [Cryomorphaceae bacterium]|nr:PhoH family protein [Cryomorphaceae bacterium]
MTKKSIQLTKVLPREVYGVNNRYLNMVQAHFPKLKITARGTDITVKGEEELIEVFEEKIDLITRHINRYNSISENQLERILQQGLSEEAQKDIDSTDDEILVFGVNGMLIKPRTVNQRAMVKAIRKGDMLFAIGPAGTGKTYTAVALAVAALKSKEVRRIILTRPAVEAGENLGFLPGDLKEKLDPYLQPLYDALRDMIPAEKLEYLLETGVIQIAPLAFMRGRTLDNAFVILDEAQNTTIAQMKMFLTRMGKSAKFLITGDLTQVDLPVKQKSGLREAMQILTPIKDIHVVHLDDKDVIRHELVKKIIKAYDEAKPE